MTNTYIELVKMKRKIIKQGHNTLTITLPSKWAQNFNLEAGDEIDLSERENGLILSTERDDRDFKTEIDITGLDIPSIWKYFMVVYREGYNEVKVKFDPKETYGNPYKFATAHKVDTRYSKKIMGYSPVETIQEITSRFIGFEIIEHHRDHCIIKAMSEPTSKEFDTSLRRVFLLIQQMAEDSVEALKTKKVDILKHIHDVDINVDKFHDYCLRVLNKTGFKGFKTHLMFSSLYILELLADEFKSIGNHIYKDVADIELTSILPMAELVLEQFNMYHNLFYKFDKSKVVEISNKDFEIHSYLPEFYKKSHKKKPSLSDDELEIFTHFRRISKYINSLLELRIEMEF